MSILECKGLAKNYGAKMALSGIDLSLDRGKIVGLLGPNGSGKSTFIKLTAGLLVPSAGEVRIAGLLPGIESKALVSYLPEMSYLSNWMQVSDLLAFFADFYRDFNMNKAKDMLDHLQISLSMRLGTMSKGTKEKVQLILVMARDAELYLLDEPIGGVDPAARDYILRTIITNYRENATVIISTHLISDIEKVLDDVVFLDHGQIVLHDFVDNIREQKNSSVDALFREVFKC